jgi:hypothetical protein
VKRYKHRATVHGPSCKRVQKDRRGWLGDDDAVFRFAAAAALVRLGKVPGVGRDSHVALGGQPFRDL